MHPTEDLTMSKLSAAVTLGLVGLALGGCATTEVARFYPQPNQEAMIRDGHPLLVSRMRGSVVIVKPAARGMQSGQRPVYAVNIHNLGQRPVTFTVASVEVSQFRNRQKIASLPVSSYEQQLGEERNRQIAHTLVAGLAVGLNSYNASQAGRGTFSASGTADYATPYGPVHARASVSGSYRDPLAAELAQGRASAENAAIIGNVVETGQRNMAVLERTVIKDNTLMPGEWYGGSLTFESPRQADNEPKTYSISIPVGDDVHIIDISQTAAR